MFSLLPLPGLWGRRVELHAGVDRELDVLGHLAPLSQVIERRSWVGRAKRARSWPADLLGGVTVGELEQDDVSGVALDQSPDRGHPPAVDEVSLPVSRHRPVRSSGGRSEIITLSVIFPDRSRCP